MSSSVHHGNSFDRFVAGHAWTSTDGEHRYAAIDFKPGTSYITLDGSKSARELEAAARQQAEVLERMEAASESA